MVNESYILQLIGRAELILKDSRFRTGAQRPELTLLETNEYCKGIYADKADRKELTRILFGEEVSIKSQEVVGEDFWFFLEEQGINVEPAVITNLSVVDYLKVLVCIHKLNLLFFFKAKRVQNQEETRAFEFLTIPLTYFTFQRGVSFNLPLLTQLIDENKGDIIVALKQVIERKNNWDSASKQEVEVYNTHFNKISDMCKYFKVKTREFMSCLYLTNDLVPTFELVEKVKERKGVFHIKRQIYEHLPLEVGDKTLGSIKDFIEFYGTTIGRTADLVNKKVVSWDYLYSKVIEHSNASTSTGVRKPDGKAAYVTPSIMRPSAELKTGIDTKFLLRAIARANKVLQEDTIYGLGVVESSLLEAKVFCEELFSNTGIKRPNLLDMLFEGEHPFNHLPKNRAIDDEEVWSFLEKQGITCYPAFVSSINSVTTYLKVLVCIKKLGLLFMYMPSETSLRNKHKDRHFLGASITANRFKKDVYFESNCFVYLLNKYRGDVLRALQETIERAYKYKDIETEQDIEFKGSSFVDVSDICKYFKAPYKHFIPSIHVTDNIALALDRAKKVKERNALFNLKRTIVDSLPLYISYRTIQTYDEFEEFIGIPIAELYYSSNPSAKVLWSRVEKVASSRGKVGADDIVPVSTELRYTYTDVTSKPEVRKFLDNLFTGYKGMVCLGKKDKGLALVYDKGKKYVELITDEEYNLYLGLGTVLIHPEESYKHVNSTQLSNAMDAFIEGKRLIYILDMDEEGVSLLIATATNVYCQVIPKVTHGYFHLYMRDKDNFIVNLDNYKALVAFLEDNENDELV